MLRAVKVFIFTLVLFSLAQLSFADSVLSGGDTDRKYVIGINLTGGVFGFQIELEGDIGLGKSISIAPRLGGTGLSSPPSSILSNNYSSSPSEIGVRNWPAFLLGISGRFAIIKGVRPHGFWIGPSMDIIFSTYHRLKLPSLTYDNKFLIIFTPSAEFGWRYTFDFGLSLQVMVRLGLHIDTNATLGFYGLGGMGVGYSF